MRTLVAAVLALLVASPALGSVGCVRPMIGPTGTRGVSELYLEETAPRGASTAPPCARDVPLVTASAAATRHHDVISRISVTCAPLLPGECDEHLRDRACAVGADAVIIDDGADGPALSPATPPQPAQPQRRVVSGELVRWTP